MAESAFKLTDLQIESVLDRLVPLVSAPEDHEFFRAVLRLKAEELSSGRFAVLVSGILKSLNLAGETK